MGIKIKKELKPQQKLVPLDVKYLFAVPLIGIVDISHDILFPTFHVKTNLCRQTIFKCMD